MRMGQRLDPRRLHARSGLPAGSGFSDSAVIAYTVQGYDAWAIQWPRLELTVYVDDQHVAMVGKRDEVIEQVAGGTASLEQVVMAHQSPPSNH